MSCIGKLLRLNRIFNISGNIVLIPMDHGITLGPIKGLENTHRTLEKIIKGGVDSVLMQKGLISHNVELLKDKRLGVIMHISGSTNIGESGSYKVPTGTVFDAVVMGCDAVSLHINLGVEKEPEMIRDFTNIASECNKYGMPLLAMVYTRGNKIVNEYDPELVKHAARFGAEMGADIVKVNYTGDRQSFAKVVEACPVPVIIAGGDKIDNDHKLLKMITDAILAGAKGISIGRNVFQHDNIEALLETINLIVHENFSYEAAMENYQGFTK